MVCFVFNFFKTFKKFCFAPKKFWNTPKRFGFVSILSFDIGTFVHSFRYRAGQEVDHAAG